MLRLALRKSCLLTSKLQCELIGSGRYSQAEIYYRNEKYEKARKLLANLEETIRLTKPHSAAHALIIRKQYACLSKLGMAKDAELLLRNTLEIVSNAPDFSAKERISARADLLLHIIQNP